jgi:hypothetical protein
MARQKWIYQEYTIEAFRDGCASQPCVHIKWPEEISVSVEYAEKLIIRLEKAIKYCNGRKRKYKDKTHNWVQKK